MSAKTYGIFISHAWDHNVAYHRLVKMLKGAPNFKWRNYSVPEHDPLAGGRELARQLDGQIRPASVVLVLAGMWVNHRDWIQKEMKIARAYGKPMIGIWPRGHAVIPQRVVAETDEVVGWNTDNIISKIRAYAI